MPLLSEHMLVLWQHKVLRSYSGIKSTPMISVAMLKYCVPIVCPTRLSKSILKPHVSFLSAIATDVALEVTDVALEAKKARILIL